MVKCVDLPSNAACTLLFIPWTCAVEDGALELDCGFVRLMGVKGEERTLVNGPTADNCYVALLYTTGTTGLVARCTSSIAL